jgi:hypothetical protein
LFKKKRGVEMQSFLWVLGSLVILVPIIYFLPLGLSLRGKGVVIVIAGLLGIAGLSANAVFPLWETLLLLFILIVLVGYILDKRLNSLLYASANTVEMEESTEYLIPNRDDDNVDRNYESKFQLLTEELDLLETIHNNEELTDYTHEEILDENTGSSPYSFDDITLIDAEINSLGTEGFNSELTFTENFAQILEEKDEHKEEASTNIPQGYLSEVEEWLNQELLKKTEPDIEKSQQKETEKISIDIDTDHDVEQFIGNQALPIFDFEKELEDVVLIANNDEIHETDSNNNRFSLEEELPEFVYNPSVEQLFLEDEDVQKYEESEVQKEGANFKLELIQALGETAASSWDVELEEFDEVSSENNLNDFQPTLLQRELLLTMLSQLKITRPRLEPKQYEKLILDHMNLKLSLHDYYTFASLLIEHYILMKEFTELSSLISSLRVKVTGHPILISEMDYIYNRYCQKSL